eukprot:jgi/Chlat1/566/Chrsp103S01005
MEAPTTSTPNVAELEIVLAAFLLPDNAARKAAEERVKALAKDPAVVPALLQLASASHHDEVRQLAAVLLRKRISGLWSRLAPDLQQQVKAALLQRVAQEPSALVRKACADVVSAIAKHTVPANQWPELLPFLFQCSQSPQEEHREVALVMFSSLTETIGEHLRPHFTTLQQVFMHGLKDANQRVRVAALKAVGALVNWVADDSDVVLFRELIPAIVEVARHCMAIGEDDTAVHAFEIFLEFVESPTPLIVPAIPSIVQFALETTANRGYELGVRWQAIQVISWFVRYRSKALIRARLIPHILSVLCPMCAEPDTDVAEDQLAPQKFAAQVLDNMAIHLPHKHIFPPCATFAKQVFADSNSTAEQRTAAVLVLGVIAQGCAEAMSPHLEELLRIVLTGLQDASPLVRAEAGFSLGQFAEHLQPDILDHYQEILPRIFSVLGDSSPDVQEKACYALDAICEELGEEVLPYIEPLIGKLLEILHSGKPEVKEIALSAIASTASAAGELFQRYAGEVLPLLSDLMRSEKDDLLRLRARATDCAGILAVAVGRQAAQPLVAPFMQAALQAMSVSDVQGFNLDYSELREYTYTFFSNMAQLLESDFAQYLPVVIPHVLNSCNLDDGAMFQFGSDDDDDEDEDDDEDDKHGRNLSIRTGVLDEKSAATHALGSFAEHVGAAMVPFFPQVLPVIQKHATYFHEDVRQQAMTAMQHIVAATLQAFPNQPDASGSSQFASEVQHVIDMAYETYLRAIHDDDDKEVVAEACASLSEVMKSAGMAALQPRLQRVSDAALLLLQEKANCQEVVRFQAAAFSLLALPQAMFGLIHSSLQDEDGDSDAEEDEAQHDDVLMDAASDLLPSMAYVLKEHYAPFWQQHFDPLMKFARPSRPPSDRTMAIATVAEVAKEMGAPIAPYVETVLPIAVKECASAESTNRRNAAFCIGKLCEHGTDQALPYMSQVLQALHPLFGPEEEAGVRDNAASAVARIIMARREALPLAQILPVLMNALPLQGDLEESTAVYGCLCSLIYAQTPEFAPLIPQAVSVFSQVVGQDDIQDEVKKGIAETMRFLQQQFPSETAAILQGLPAEYASQLNALMTL